MNFYAVDITEVAKRWRNLRDTFTRKLKEAKKASGAPADDEPEELTSSWVHFKQLLFLKDIIEPRQYEKPFFVFILGFGAGTRCLCGTYEMGLPLWTLEV